MLDAVDALVKRHMAECVEIDGGQSAAQRRSAIHRLYPQTDVDKLSSELTCILLAAKRIPRTAATRLPVRQIESAVKRASKLQLAAG
jgi:hypothetical protein